MAENEVNIFFIVTGSINNVFGVVVESIHLASGIESHLRVDHLGNRSFYSGIAFNKNWLRIVTQGSQDSAMRIL